MKLHVGCGERILPGFVNVDLRELPGVDVPNCDASDLHMFESGSADWIYACHVLEHFPRPKTFDVLLEWNRVLRPGGTLRLAVLYRRSGDYENLLNWIYGGREYPENAHYRQFTLRGLSALLIESGFKRVSRDDWAETEHANVDDFSKAYVPHMDVENGILLSLNVASVKHLYPPDYR